MRFPVLSFSRLSVIVLMAAGLAIAGCSGVKSEAKYPTASRDDLPSGSPNDIYAKPDSVFGGKGAIGGLFGRKDADNENGIGVNSFLWRASLDTVSFMPLASADPFGGVILTDWYSAQETPDERIKLNVFILDKQLRADAIQVKVFRQTKKKGSDWKDASVDPATSRSIEDAILTRARQLRVAKVNGRD